MAIGTGKMVRSPWMTSNPKSAGMPSRCPSTASRCRRLISAGSVTNNSDPTSPRPSAASTNAAGEGGGSLWAGWKSAGLVVALGPAPTGK